MIADLLEIDSVDDLIAGLVSRSVLPGGRFEAQGFGLGQHSTASAGAVLVGLGGTPEVSDDVLRPLVQAAADLVYADGSVRGHDADSRVGSTSWSVAQLLLGLSTRASLGGGARIQDLARYLMSFQDPRDGGWPFRFTERSSPVFAFYPSLALARAHRLGLISGEDVDRSIRQLARHHRRTLLSPELSPEERLLALTALEILVQSSSRSIPVGFLAGERVRAIEACSPPGAFSAVVRDRTIVADEQPMWHAMLWAPLLYLCVRRWVAPLHPVATVLARDLLANFDRSQLSWSGPGSANRSTGGVSWASALALRTVSALGRDLRQHGLLATTLRDRIHTLAGPYEYDVVLSFAGANRPTAERIRNRLTASGLRVFYDRDHEHHLLGEDLAQVLQDIYLARSRYAVVLVSQAFLDSKWAGNWEWRAILARMQRQRHGYVLPYFLEDGVQVPGLNPTIGHLNASEYSVEEFCRIVVRKLSS